jgi:hypothetical protein
MEHWLKSQLNEAHKLLDDMGVPDREHKTDPRTGEENKPFSLGVPDRIRWLKKNWQARDGYGEAVRASIDYAFEHAKKPQ